MKIERKKNVIAFKEIEGKIGTCFDYENEVYMIIPSYFDVCYDDKIIALNLESNELMCESEIDNNDFVTILNLKLVEE